MDDLGDMDDLGALAALGDQGNQVSWLTCVSWLTSVTSVPWVTWVIWAHVTHVTLSVSIKPKVFHNIPRLALGILLEIIRYLFTMPGLLINSIWYLCLFHLYAIVRSSYKIPHVTFSSI